MAAAINDSTEFHGVKATATATVADMGAITAANFTPTDNMVINGETVIGISTQIDDADGSLVDAINSLTDKTGVVASIDSDNSLLLTAEDGRNIDVQVNGAAGPGIAPAGARVYRGGLTLQSEENIEIGAAGGACGNPNEPLG